MSARIVKIDPSRGWASGMYEVLGNRNDEVNVKPVSGGKAAWIYRAHTFTDGETINYQKKWLAERAAKIGKK